MQDELINYIRILYEIEHNDHVYDHIINLIIKEQSCYANSFYNHYCYTDGKWIGNYNYYSIHKEPNDNNKTLLIEIFNFMISNDIETIQHYDDQDWIITTKFDEYKLTVDRNEDLLIKPAFNITKVIL